MTQPLFDLAPANPVPDQAKPQPLLEIRVSGTPGPQGSKNARAIYKGRGENRTFTGKIAQQESSKKVKPWREAVAAAAKEAMAGHTFRLQSALMVEMVFTMRRPASRPTWWPTGERWSKTTPMRPAGYPDVSKLARSTEDALTTAGVWKDDGRVVEYGRLAKVYPGDDPDALEEPGAVIRIYRIGATR
jgi:Holliday junction resolvase RusA-like endonuclease